MPRKDINQYKGMVDISRKKPTQRTARAQAVICLGKKAYTILSEEGSPKGNVLETARVSAIMAAKSTPQIIPMCHPLELSKAKVEFHWDKTNYTLAVITEISCLGRTGVEMEALTAASIGALAIYDMMKFADKGIEITDVRLLKKTGGKSGDFKR